MKHVCAESYAKKEQFDDEIDDRREKLGEDGPDYEGDNSLPDYKSL